jgi:hypothetical protein
MIKIDSNSKVSSIQDVVGYIVTLMDLIEAKEMNKINCYFKLKHEIEHME